MKVEHRIAECPTEPKTTKSYGARVRSITIEGKDVIVYWVIYTHRKRNNGVSKHAQRD